MFIRFQFYVVSVLVFIAIGLTSGSSMAQYVMNGSTQQLSCNCYRLTEAINTQGGSVWNSNQIDLTNPFDFTFDVYLGNNDEGADGIAFVLQPVSTAVGSTGGGLGYLGIVPSIAVEIDTYQNGWDPSNDHMAVQANGDNNHNTVNNLAGPVNALPGGNNLEDGQTHLMRVTWDPILLTLTAYMDGIATLTYTGDLVTNYLTGDPNVFWGFTGSTGGLNNVQEFCLTITPGLAASTGEICAGEEVIFTDNSFSALGDVVEWDWNFGNGTTSSDETPGAITFLNAGTYNVVQTIVDAAGCDASDSLEILVNPNPEAAFDVSEVCEGEETLFTDQSSIASGTLSSWEWEFGDLNSGVGGTTTNTYSAPGIYQAGLLVTSNDGCVDSAEATVIVYENPTAEASHESNSLDAVLTAQLENGEVAFWNINDTTFTGLDVVNYTFPDSGWYDITLTVTNANGCDDTLIYSIYIEGIPEYEVGNVFTPNGDEFNEYFQPFTYSMIEANMKIYNRWGIPVYKFNGLIPPPATTWGWDGSINGGAEAAEGTYYYVLDLKGTDGNNFSDHGTVTLVR
jgi:gliding motility-associated-like protein